MGTQIKIKKETQPEIKKGTEFIGWATFNWGLCHQRVYRTRKEAKNACLNLGGRKEEKWDDVKDHFRVEKVKCIVI